MTVSVPYTIEEHQHRASAWAASRAASVKGCRFNVETGRAILEACGFNIAFHDPNNLPSPEKVDDEHKGWRRAMIDDAVKHGLQFKHGVAAKLINCYLKFRFVCGGQHLHTNVQSLHPPIDDLLLKRLGEMDLGGNGKQWRRMRGYRWSKFDSGQYQEVIDLIKQSMGTEPLWRIEEYWKGYQ